MTKSMKRIHKVVITRMADRGPDTSYLGKYSGHAESDYSIDRKHDTDCITQVYNRPTGEGLRILESAQQYLCDRLNELQASAEDNSVPFDDVEWYDDGDSFIYDFLNGDEEFCSGACGSWNSREHQYFNPNWQNYKGESHADIVKYCLQDYARMESLNAGNWFYIGIVAEANCYIGASLLGGLNQTITSGGLWGIESDSDASYFREVEQEQLSELREQLHGIGFSYRAIASAFKNVEHEND